MCLISIANNNNKKTSAFCVTIFNKYLQYDIFIIISKYYIGNISNYRIKYYFFLKHTITKTNNSQFCDQFKKLKSRKRYRLGFD